MAPLTWRALRAPRSKCSHGAHGKNERCHHLVTRNIPAAGKVEVWNNQLIDLMISLLRVQYFPLSYLLQGPESWRSITFLFFMNMNMLIRRIIKSCNTDIFDRRKHIASVSCLELMRYDCPYLLYLISCRKFPRSHVSYHTIIISGYLWLVLGIFHASFCLKVYDSC